MVTRTRDWGEILKVLKVRNAHQALAEGLRLLETTGYRRPSRYGDVILSPEPVATVYSHPRERVVWYQERDYNVAFCLYESLWMLAGRRDVAPLLRYVSDFDKFSDDGKTLHSAYGFRWRKHFGFDQLEAIFKMLHANPDDRRAVLQIWDVTADLNVMSKDIPCNDMVTFQIGKDGELNITVFCRSNDIIWGAYYANAFQFSFLQEYMASRLGCAVGTYTQISVNYHAYVDKFDKYRGKFWTPDMAGMPSSILHHYPMIPPLVDVDWHLTPLLDQVDAGKIVYSPQDPEWVDTAKRVFSAHQQYKELSAPENFRIALTGLASSLNYDWVISMEQWIERRHTKWLAKQEASCTGSKKPGVTK